ncbi:MAG: hypothetical protein K1W26_09060, partial [Acetatifactor sp.]
MRKKSRRIRFLSGIIIILLWGGLEPVLLCDAAFPFHISCPAPDGPVLRTRRVNTSQRPPHRSLARRPGKEE